MNVNPYVLFNGTCAEAFRFYAEVLGAKVDSMMTHSEMPGSPVAPDWGDKVMHAQIRIGDTLLMGSDAPPNWYEKPQGASVSLDVPSPAEADRIFAALAEGGNVRMPIAKTFWAERFGMLTDRFGIPWMVNCAVAA